MDGVFDLFGDPVPEGHGRPGRPSHVATFENRNKVKMLLACGWDDDRIAGALGITRPTLRKHYLRELKIRAVARDKLDAQRRVLLWQQGSAGNVAAMREFGRLLEADDLVRAEREFDAPTKSAPRTVEGKKAAARREAAEVVEDSEWSDLLPRPTPALTLQ